MAEPILSGQQQQQQTGQPPVEGQAPVPGQQQEQQQQEPQFKDLDNNQNMMLQALKLKASSRMRDEMTNSGMTPEQWTQKQRQKWRWASGATRGILQSAADLAGDFNAGIFSLLGPTVQDALSEIGIGRRHDQPPLMGIPGRGMEVAGQALSMAGGVAGMLGKAGVRTGLALNSTLDGYGGTAARVMQDMLKTAQTNPKMFLTAEFGGGFSAGATDEALNQSGYPDETGIAALGAGMVGGITPVVGLNFFRQTKNWALLHLAPWTEASGELYAARRLQGLAGDPEAAAQKVKKGKEGISPARRTQDQNLLSLEAKILSDDPVMTRQFTEALEGARRLAQTELRNEVGELRQPGEWERSVIERAAAPGTTITEGEPQKMLEQAYESFRPLYNEFAGYPIRPSVETPEGPMPFPQLFTASLADPSVIASRNERKAAELFLKDELSRVNPSTLEKDPTIDSSILLTVRQNVRDRVRELMATPDRANHITANLLSNAETAITMSLEQQLPAGALQTMNQIDNQYRMYHVVEQAIFTAGDRPLSAQVLGQAVKGSVPPGAAEDMRKMVRAGRDIESVIGNPANAKAMIRGQDPKTTAEIQSSYLDALWRRSLVRDVGEDGSQLVSGRRLLAALSSEASTAAALGIDKKRYTRMMDIAREVQAMDMKTPKQIDAILSEGPSNIMQLLATLVGAKSGQHMAGKGIGSSLVLAQYFSKRARRTLGKVFGDEATRILTEAHRNPELYAALLVKPTSPMKEQDKAARVLNAWLYPTGTQMVDGEEDQE